MASYGRQYSDPDNRPADASHIYPGYQRQYRHENMRRVPEDRLEKRTRSRHGSVGSLDSDRLHSRQSYCRPHSRSFDHSHCNRQRSPSPRSRSSRSRSRSPSPSPSPSPTGNHRIRSRAGRGRSRDSSLDGRHRTRRWSISSSPEDLARGGQHAMKRAHSADPTSAMVRTGAAMRYYGNGHGHGHGHGTAATHAHRPARGKSTARNQRQTHAMEVAVGNAARAAYRVSVPDAPQRSMVQKAGKVAGVALTGYLVDYVLDRNAKKHPLKHIGVAMLQGALMDRLIDTDILGDWTKLGPSEYRSNTGRHKEAPF